jgi:hypothetical protein
MSQDIGMTPNLRLGFGVAGFPGRSWCSGRGSWWPSGGLVVPGCVEGEVSEQLARGGVGNGQTMWQGLR